MNWKPQMAWGASTKPKAAKTKTAPRAHQVQANSERLEGRDLMAIDATIVSPADDAAAVEVGGNLVLDFGRNVVKGPGAGRVLIKNAADDSLIEAVNVNSSRVTIAGSKVTIDPASNLPANAKLYVNLDDGAFRDAAGSVSKQVIFSEDFETLNLADSGLASNSKFETPDPFEFDNYVLTFRGVLDVKTAGEYTFGGNSDDGMYMLLDLNRDDFVDFFDSNEQIIFDDTTHGNVNKLSTVDGRGAVTLKAGKYAFEFAYFDAGGGSSGEFFYAPGAETAFDAAKFALFGDDSKGIAISGDITATSYFSSGLKVGGLTAAYSLVDGTVPSDAGYPAVATVPVTNVRHTGGSGNYGNDLPVPGAPVDPNDTKLDYALAPPTGWNVETNIQNTRPEYNGWTFLNKNFWTRQQGNQDRTVFTTNEDGLAQGTVMVMDPDAFDDFVSINPENLNTFVTLPVIQLSGVSENTVNISFDSSFRPYETMTGLVDVSFDGGQNWQNLLTLNTASLGGVDSVLDRANIRESLAVENPGSGEMLIRFGMTKAGNDWWWAVDNVEVTADVASEVSAPIKGRTAWNFTTSNTVAPFPGDVNGDRKVDINDFAILRRNFNKTPATLADGDLDGSNRVDIADFALLRANFNKSGSASIDTASAGVAVNSALSFSLGNGLSEEENG